MEDSKEGFDSHDDCFYQDGEPIDPDVEFQEFLKKTKENLFKLSQKSERSIEAKENVRPFKYTLFSEHWKPDTNESRDVSENSLSELKDSPVQKSNAPSDNLSSSILTTNDVNTESTCNVGNDEDIDFSKFISELKNNLPNLNETMPSVLEGSGSPKDTSSDDSKEDTSSDDSKKDKSENRMKIGFRINSKNQCNSSAEPSSSSGDISTDDECFENFISVVKNNGKSQSKKNSELAFPLISQNILKKQRSYSLANEDNPPNQVLVSKRSQSVSSNAMFNLDDAEAEAKHNFMTKRKVYAAHLYKFFNQTVFNNRLPEDMSIKWSGYLKSTAGKTFCKCKSEQYSCHIELSTDVLISFDRLRDTLLHEMCHAACWLVNHSHDNHGPLWKIWASRCNLILPQIEVPSRCHQYELSYSYVLKCVNCDFVRKRHKMCPKLNRKKCPSCQSSTILTKT